MAAPQTKIRMVSRTKVHAFALALFSLALLPGTATVVFAVAPQSTSRKIVSDDFTRSRPEAPPAAPSTAPPTASQGKGARRQAVRTSTINSPRRQRSYRLASRPVLTRDQGGAGASSPGAIIARLGITIWKLRQVRDNEAGSRALIREKNRSSGWVPERVEADTAFREGDHVRLTVESPQAGYLYVIDRELFADGTTGEAMLIYPWPGADNKMRPGRLVDIPAQEDDPGYFTTRLSGSRQTGELLTFMLTASPLDLPISDKPYQVSDAQMEKWEKMWGGESERFEMEDGAGEAWTDEERQAATNQGTRQLTRDDPAPQTIYRLPASRQNAFLINVQLRYAR